MAGSMASLTISVLKDVEKLTGQEFDIEQTAYPQ